MRLLHPRTIEILASHPEFPRTHLSHCWSEIFKWKASGQKHPKCFIDDDRFLGKYLKFLYEQATAAGCNLDAQKIKSLSPTIVNNFTSRGNLINVVTCIYFDSDYLFSDATSLYFKGINIFPDIFGDEWRKLVPVESLKEIKRQVDKTLSK